MHKYDLIFASIGSLISILFFILVNYLTSPSHIWFIYPVFFLLLWPVSVYFIKKREYKIHSLCISIIIILYLFLTNFLYSPSHPWALYAFYPIIWWPIMVIFENARKTISLGLIGSFITIVYYSILNLVISSGYPWAIYPAFIVLWWPLALYHAKHKKFFQFSISSSLFISVFFIIVNMVSSPNEIWAVYPIFAVLWWPLSMYYYYFKRKESSVKIKTR
ncbi:hypothetical protein AN964_19735 [Heyndrickxia shackletonii]|uniref:Uncharacterized protein n=1 Tax=Heyndrickxia shackletonii TaxID=157838 RepID=A0A0Q3WTM8_9BACI|nr:hypothetical protein AN964_19735 [Heyndrickxia shackletonii]